MKNNRQQFNVAMRTFLIPFLLLPCFAQGVAPDNRMAIPDQSVIDTQMRCEENQDQQSCQQQALQAELNDAIYQGQTKEAYRLLKLMTEAHFLAPATSPSPLVTAIEKGNLKIVKALLDKGDDPLARDAKGVTLLAAAIERAQANTSGISRAMYRCLSLALDKAAAQGLLKPVFPLNATLAFAHKPDPVLLGYLLKYGANPGEKSAYGNTAIEMAFNQDQPKMMKVILNAKPRDPSLNLDKLAYRAYFEKKSDMLKLLQAAGGNHIRYAKHDPQALFDALQPDRKPEELEFVLRSGANPNALQNPQSRITPLSIAVPYPAKLLMLIKHGADVNAQGPSGTALANVLFRSGMNIYAPSRQTAAAYPSLEIARLLLSSGAQVNGDIGGFGQFGALAATKPGDNAMIQLLLEHGATLTPNLDRKMIALRAGKKTGDANLPEPVPEGPITLAMELEREDLALAILARDKKIDPNDRLALVKATRKSWDKVALALLQAGADANTAGNDGISALAIAKRKQNEVMVRALIGAGAPDSTPPAPLLFNGRNPFETLVGNEIDRLVHFDPPSFALANALQEEKQNPFAFYGKMSQAEKPDNTPFNYFEIVECERSAGFQFLAHANLTGSIQVGICDSDIPRLRTLATEAEPSVKQLLESLDGPEITANPRKLKSMGWLYEKSRDKDGAEIYFFPVIVVGHGLLVSSTVLIFTPDNLHTVILQADTMNLCENHRIHSPLCDNTQATLIDIARHVLLDSVPMETPAAKAP